MEILYREFKNELPEVGEPIFMVDDEGFSWTGKIKDDGYINIELEWDLDYDVKDFVYWCYCDEITPPSKLKLENRIKRASKIIAENGTTGEASFVQILEKTDTLDTMGKPIVLGLTYGYSVSNNGITKSCYGLATKVDKGYVWITPKQRFRAVYENAVEETEINRTYSRVKANLVFKVDVK